MTEGRDQVALLRYLRESMEDLKAEYSGVKLRLYSVEQAMLGIRADFKVLDESITRLTFRIRESTEWDDPVPSLAELKERLAEMNRRLDAVELRTDRPKGSEP